MEQTKKGAYGSKRKNFLNVNTSELAELIPKYFSGNDSLKQPEFQFGKIHPTIKQLGIAVGVYLIVGTLVFCSVYDNIKGNKEVPFIDSLYFTVTTLTTVGYGDLVPNATIVKVLCCVFVLPGIAIVGLIITKAAEYLVEKQEIILIKAFNRYEKYGKVKMMDPPEPEPDPNPISFKCTVVASALGGLMLFGILFLFIVEELDFMDAVFCVFTTVTTVGYGDKAFATIFGRIFAIFWILTCTFGFGQLYMYLLELFTETKQQALANWVVMQRMSNDGDNGVAEAAEFAVNKLLEMGKTKEEDISRLRKEFEDLDVHNTGFVSVSDILSAESKK